ncbi:PH, RCC1 and FYVE domains-containing protein 1-like [Aristolochia californica]|uniref:PH, RCC1 and FYVE domains-containing protein 1-like n=1 Tax=Aristolochia californica TaxID=171875 RepID=UPI0035E2CA9D
MAEIIRSGAIERDVEQAITALKKGAILQKHGRRGKPKFCPFRLSNDESLLLWYSGKDEKQLKLSDVSRIIPGQRTAIFQRYPQPHKEYQSFSLIYNDRSLDLICKDKDEAEVWFVGLKALISRGAYTKWKPDARSDRGSSDTSSPHTRSSPLTASFGGSDTSSKHSRISQRNPNACEGPAPNGLGKAFCDVILYTAASKGSTQPDPVCTSLNSFSSASTDNRGSTADGFRVSLSSAVSSSSQGSAHEDFDALGDVFMWGKGIADGLLGGGTQHSGSLLMTMDAFLPKALESTTVLDVHNIACGSQHAVLVTKQGGVFSWGEESGGRLGHGVEADVSQPKLVEALSGMNIELVSCGEYHTCAVTLSGDLYTWGDGTHNYGLLGHGSEVSHWIPKKVMGLMEGVHVSSVSCGPWHTAVVTSAGQLFTFGDGTFGVLGHGDRRSASVPREVESLKGLRTVRAACGVWHTAAVVEVMVSSSGSTTFPSGKLFTWGDGDKGRLGHSDNEPRLVPACVAALVDPSFCQVACGHSVTIALTTGGRVYTMGSAVFGQLGDPNADGKVPNCIEGKIHNSFVEEIACGSHHVAILTSRTEVYTWGKGANGRLGHGDNDDRNTPTLVEVLKDKQVKSVVCGSNFTAVICLHKWVSSADQSICSGCRNPFGFRRKRHNCYNCGLVFCKACSSRKSLRASLAPNVNKPYRVCDDCYVKLKKVIEAGPTARAVKHRNVSSVPTPPSEETIEVKMQGQLSRLSSVDSFKQGKWNKESSICRTSSVLNGSSSNWGRLSSSRSSYFMPGPSKKIFSASVPGSRMVSRASSPVSRKQSPARSMTPTPVVIGLSSPDLILSSSKQRNDSLNQEILILRAQVEDLTRKSQLLEVELERTTKQLKEATAKAGEETAKCKAAKEVIKSLNVQLRDLAERVPGGSMDDCRSHISNVLNVASMDNNNLRSLTESHELDANELLSNSDFCNGAKATAAEEEWVEQDEPGVYITLCSLANGSKELKRVRFSRKRFSEKQAEKWWSENRVRVLEKYNISMSEKSVSGGSIPGGSPSGSENKDSVID